ncbi:MAG: diguanylate cyclase [Bacilli bacterium]|nr:diguanylate cyclase [Bacilli bacterium]MBN2877015.1 diguanylate cyclase [Bacilli bacterium]
MSKNKSFSKSFREHVRKFTIGENDFEYAISFGMLSSLFMFVKGLFSYFILDATLYYDGTVELLTVVLLGALFLFMVLIHMQIIPQNKKFTQAFIKTYPYILVVFCLLISFNFLNASNQLFSFVIGMVVLALTQIYSLKNRIVLFLFAWGSYLILYIVFYRVPSDTLSYVSLVTVAILISYITATVHSIIYNSQKDIIYEMNNNSKMISQSIEQLEETNRELRLSQNMTASMLKITEEVLKNENIESILQLVLDEAMELIPNSQAGSILITDENGNFSFAAARGYRLEKLKKIKLKYEELYQSSLDDPFEPYIIQNLETFDEVHIGRSKTDAIWSTSHSNVAKSCMTCSFQHDNNFYGAINIDNFTSETIYEEKDKYLLKQLAKELEIIISIHKLYEKALRPTKIDDLTGAYTRTYCMKLLIELIASDQYEIVSVSTLDIDRLKAINDKYGHDVGDKYLHFFAKGVMNSGIKENIFGRVGGDEFLLIFPHLTEQETKEQIKQIRTYLKEHKFVPNSSEEEITFSAGIAIYPKENSEIKEIIKLSDKRMYQDKRVEEQN